MGAMRVWLDQHRFELSGFSCRDFDDGVLVSVEFKIANQAQAFAEHFGGRADGTSELPRATLDTGVSSAGVVG
jgi:hypothetical protein